MTDKLSTSRLVELDNKRKSLHDDAVKILDKIEKETDEARSQELQEEYSGLMGAIDKNSELIEAHQDLLRRETEAEEKRQAYLEEQRQQAGSDLDAKRPQLHKRSERSDDEREATEERYRDLFYRKLLPGRPLSFEESEFIDSRTHYERIEGRAQSAGTDTAGGHTVPELTEAEVIKTMKLWGPMMSGVTRMITTPTGAKIEWPTVDDTSNTGAKVAENAAASEEDVTFGVKELDAYWFSTGYIKVSQQLLDDSVINVESLIAELMGERAGRRANSELTTGDGTGDVDGIVTAAAATTGNRTVTAANNAITFDEVADFENSIDPAYAQSPMYRMMMHKNILNYLRKLKDGQSNYLWQMGDVRMNEPNTIWGVPYSINQAMDSTVTASKNVIVAGDFSKYIVRRVKGFSVRVLRELFAINNQIGIIGWHRLDGELMDNDAVKVLRMKA